MLEVLEGEARIANRAGAERPLPDLFYGMCI
jgi:hypothetical protein